MSARVTIHCDGCDVPIVTEHRWVESAGPEGWVKLVARAPESDDAVLELVIADQVSRSFTPGRVDFCSVDCLAATLRRWVEESQGMRLNPRS